MMATSSAESREPVTGDFVISRIEDEWHVLFRPDHLPFHFLSVARFQNRSRALAYAELETIIVDDGEGQMPDVCGMQRAADPKPVESVKATRPEPASASPLAPEPSPEPAAPAPTKSGPVAGPACTVVVKPDVMAMLQPERQTVPTAEDAEAAQRQALAEAAEARRNLALDHYAEHGGSQAEVAARTGIPPGSLSGIMSVARKDGDPRIAAGDAKRQPMPVRAAEAIARSEAQNRATAEASQPVDPARKLTHAEMVEAAKKAVPAPNFGNRRGVSCRTG